MRNNFLYGFICIILLISGCEKKSAETAENFTVVTIEPKAIITPLHFSGTLDPINSQSVLSPLDGRVNHVLFYYGQKVEKGQTLITVDATKLSDDYRKTVSDFLEKKQAYETSVISFQGTQALYKAGVLSQEEYYTQENSQKNNTLAYFQAKYDLDKLLLQANLPASEIENLTLSNMEQVNKILNKKFTEINVAAPVAGIALFPSADQKKEGGGGARILAGDELKAGQLILSIGDLSGFSMKINVSEISVNSIRPGLPAKITGDAFPGIELSGSVVSVASQANPHAGGDSTLSLFETLVQIPNVPPAKQKIIHVGMTAQVELDIPESPQIYVPIKAVFEKNGQKKVTRITKSGRREDTPVITGKTTLTEVAIVQGLSPGDHIAVPN